jgi:hypothetical protein
VTSREAFRAGFLARCVELGMSPDQVAAASSSAADLVSHGVKEALFGDAVNTAMNFGLGMATLLPVGIGAAGGYALAKAKNEDVDVDDVKREELIREYRRLSREAKDSVRAQVVRRSGS